jgi:hypothetical protein
MSSPTTERSQAWKARLKSDCLYDTDKRSVSCFRSHRQKVDPYFVDKLDHVHNNGITLTIDALQIPREVTKNEVH